MKFLTLSESEYQAFYDAFNKPNFWQSVAMSKFEARKGWHIHYVGISDEQGTIIAGATLISRQVFFNYCEFKALRGFLIDYDNLELVDFFLKNLQDYLHEHHCLHFSIDPYAQYLSHQKDGSVAKDAVPNTALLELFQKHGYHHLGFRIGNNNDFEPRFMSVLNLENETEASLLHAFDAQTRQNVNNTIKTGIKVRELAEDEFEILHQIVSSTGERRNFKNPGLNYYCQFKEAFQDKMKVLYAYLDTEDYYARYQEEYAKHEAELAHIETLIAESDSPKNEKKRENCLKLMAAAQKRVEEAEKLKQEHGKEIALGAAMFVTTPYEIIYLFSGSYKEYNRFKGAYAIQWAMIRYGLSQHIKRYNFYGISGIFKESAEDYGVFLFKKGFNADVEELIGNFELIDFKPIYQIYRGLRACKNKLMHH